MALKPEILDRRKEKGSRICANATAREKYTCAQSLALPPIMSSLRPLITSTADTENLNSLSINVCSSRLPPPLPLHPIIPSNLHNSLRSTSLSSPSNPPNLLHRTLRLSNELQRLRDNKFNPSIPRVPAVSLSILRRHNPPRNLCHPCQRRRQNLASTCHLATITRAWWESSCVGVYG